LLKNQASQITDFHLMFFDLGIRRKEAMEVRWKHINWKEHSITPPAEITKTGKERKIGLGARLYRELLTHKKKGG
jgi:integrase